MTRASDRCDSYRRTVGAVAELQSPDRAAARCVSSRERSIVWSVAAAAPGDVVVGRRAPDDVVVAARCPRRCCRRRSAVPQTMLSSSDVPQTMLSQSAPPQSVPHTMLSSTPSVPHTMLSSSNEVPQTMLSSPSVPHTMLSPPSSCPRRCCRTRGAVRAPDDVVAVVCPAVLRRRPRRRRSPRRCPSG